MRQLLTVAAATILGASLPSLQAQSSPSRPAADQRVRVSLVDGSIVEARAVGWASDTLVVHGASLNDIPLDAPMRIPRASITSYSPRSSRRSLRDRTM